MDLLLVKILEVSDVLVLSLLENSALVQTSVLVRHYRLGCARCLLEM